MSAPGSAAWFPEPVNDSLWTQRRRVIYLLRQMIRDEVEGSGLLSVKAPSVDVDCADCCCCTACSGEHCRARLGDCEDSLAVFDFFLVILTATLNSRSAWQHWVESWVCGGKTGGEYHMKLKLAQVGADWTMTRELCLHVEYNRPCFYFYQYYYFRCGT